jgi:hypothetical protein
VILLWGPLTRAEIPRIEPNTVSGHLSLDRHEQDSLAQFITQCRVDKKNLESAKKAYRICVDRNEIAPAWWQEPWAVVSVAIVSFSLGALVID